MAHAQLCQLAGDWRGTLPDGGAMAESKIDGWRCLAYVGLDGEYRLWTRNGMPLDGAEHIRQAMLAMERETGEPMFFDGEIQVERPMWNGYEIAPRGTLAHTKKWFEKEWKWDDRAAAGKLHLFDCMTLAEWQAGGSDVPLYQRKARLVELWKAADIDPTAAEPVADQWCSDAADVLAMARGVWAAGGEGIVLKDAEAPYERKRSKAWLKIKPDGPWRRSI